MFDVCLLGAKNRLFEFDHQQMNTFKFVRCSKNDVRVRSMFDEMVFDPSPVSPNSYQFFYVCLFVICLHCVLRLYANQVLVQFKVMLLGMCTLYKH